MGIEIRPAAVMGQVRAKAGLLGSLLSEVQDKRAASQGFSEDGLLSGRGWDAARERVSSYALLLSSLEASVRRTLQIDAGVSAALAGYFGGCAYVSEDEWLERKSEALSRCDWLEGSLRQMRRLSSRDLRCERLYAASIRFAQDSASFAGDMLSKIYSYCSQTNGAYAEVGDLNACIARGASAFSASGYSAKAGRWGELDTSWRAELAVRGAKVAEAVMLEESRSDPEAVFVSGDRQYVYYQGRKWRIESPSDSEEPGFYTVWKRVYEDREIPFTEVEWAKILAGFGTDSVGGGGGGKGINIANEANGNILGLLSSSLENIKNSISSRKLVFRFEERPDGAGRVTILGKEPYPQGSLFFSDCAPSKSDANILASRIFEEETGEKALPLVSLYDVLFTFDAARSDPESYTSVFYFGQDGSLEEQVIRYPEDKVQVMVGGLIPGADITDKFYSTAHGSADRAFAEKIRESIDGASQEGGK